MNWSRNKRLVKTDMDTMQGPVKPNKKMSTPIKALLAPSANDTSSEGRPRSKSTQVTDSLFGKAASDKQKQPINAKSAKCSSATPNPQNIPQAAGPEQNHCVDPNEIELSQSVEPESRKAVSLKEERNSAGRASQPAAQSVTEFQCPNKTKRRNTLTVSTDQIRKLSSHSMKKISSFNLFRRSNNSNSEDFNSSFNGQTFSPNTTPPKTRKKGTGANEPPIQQKLSQDFLDAPRILPKIEVDLERKPNIKQKRIEKTELELSDPEFVEYFQQNTSESDKSFVRKYIALKQNLEAKLALLDSEYTKLLGLEPTENVVANLRTLDSTHGDDLIFHCVNLFETEEHPEKILALSIHRDFENYIRETHKLAFENVFKLINIKTLQNSITSSSQTEIPNFEAKKKTQVFESNVYEK